MKFWIGCLVLVFSVASCATAFQWKYYNSSIPSRIITQADVGRSLSDIVYEEGIMLGKLNPNGWPDLPLSECKPDSAIKMKCVSMIENDFFDLKDDNEKCHSDLISCQKGPMPTPEPTS